MEQKFVKRIIQKTHKSLDNESIYGKKGVFYDNLYFTRNLAICCVKFIIIYNERCNSLCPFEKKTAKSSNCSVYLKILY